MNLSDYILAVNILYRSGLATEHSYRGDLQRLLTSLCPRINVTNEPANVTDCGNPDYVITNGDITVGYIESKDIGKDLNSKQYKEQFSRYKKALDNLIITDYIWFQFFENGELVHEIRIGDISGNAIKALPENFPRFEALIQDFCIYIGQTIKSPKVLAKMMASKARLLQDILESAITSDENSEETTALKGQYDAFKRVLIHDLKPSEFADIYAQTLAYGMFAARLHDSSLDTFTRQKAAELIPKTNPFLRKLFQGLAGYDIDQRIRPTVDNLADVFRATDVIELLRSFGKTTHPTDPIIHFYETFLTEYDPKLRKARGVWFTPEPVVVFIVRAVDEILKSDFSLPMGLSDTSKSKIKIDTQVPDKRSASGYKEVETEVHKVQILDPATGTGTFLAEVVKHIFRTNFKDMQGAWSGYVEEHLIPRLIGFELLMASYAMAHLKMDMLLTETGYKPSKEQRFNIYLTNSLEEYHPDTGTLFASWLSTEANEANHVKRDTPVMVVLGNPPYSISSSNKGEWIMNLIADYKKGLNERKMNIDDDYIKFIRYAHFLIAKTGEGIIAFICNNSFLDGVTQRQMRYELLCDFDAIYILDLHGDVKKQDKAEEGAADENVFDIMQGVAICIFVKKNKRSSGKLANLYYCDIRGSRNCKNNFLRLNTIDSVAWILIKPEKPYFVFNVRHDPDVDYSKGMALNELFVNYSSGIQTKNDALTVRYSALELESVIKDFRELSVDELNGKYSIKEGAWKTENAKDDLARSSSHICKIQYRPFDFRFTALTPNSNGFLGRPRFNIMRHFVYGDNLGLICNRQAIGEAFSFIGVSKFVIAHGTFYLGNRGQDYLLPLYLYSDQDAQLALVEGCERRKPNLNLKIVEEIAAKINLTFVPEKDAGGSTFAPIDILDYVYAILHQPSYREKYRELLKTDFPRVPYPSNADIFWQLVKIGSELRQIHLLEPSKLKEFITQYPKDGDNVITRKFTTSSPGFELSSPENQSGRVWINDQQFFDGVPLSVWEVFVGGYQPAKKWLKDRVGRVLDYEDIRHYQLIIACIDKTLKLMDQIDGIEIL